MTEQAFRFGFVNALAETGDAWIAAARRAEDLGFGTLLVPDTRRTLSPFPAMAAAAAASRELRVGSYVLSVPNRTPGLVAWETETLQMLTGGRFELGLGPGRPGSDRDAADLGVPFGPAGERVRQVEEVIDAVRGTKILVAAGKPRMLRLAAERADIVALGLPPYASEADLAAAVATVREAAGDRFDALELHTNVVAVAPSAAEIPDWVSRMTGGGDPQKMAADGGISFFVGQPREIADQVLRRRETYGISYVAVGSMFAEAFAPVIELLAGK